MKLDEINRRILILVENEHLGVSQLAQEIGLHESRISRRVERLHREGFIEKFKKGTISELQVTANGKLALSQIATELHGVNDASIFTDGNPILHLHALQVKYPLFRTAYSSVEAILQSRGIQFKRTGNPACPMYDVTLSPDIALKITKLSIIAYGPQVDASISLPTSILESQALSKNTKAVNAFLEDTGIRAQRKLDGALLATISYKEIAQTDSDLAKAVSKGRGYVTLAIDRLSGRPIAWTDHSDTWEWESSDSLIVEEARKFTQGIKDGDLKPYKDIQGLKLGDQRHEKEIAELRDVVLELAKENKAMAVNQTTHIPFFQSQTAVNNAILDGLARLKGESEQGARTSHVGVIRRLWRMIW